MSEHGKRQWIADGDPDPRGAWNADVARAQRTHPAPVVEPAVTARCGSSIPHGGHWIGRQPSGAPFCAGNRNIVVAEPTQMPKGSCPDHPFAEYCIHGGVVTGTKPPTTPSFTPRRAGHSPAEDHAGFIDGRRRGTRWQSFLAERKRRIEETGE